MVPVELSLALSGVIRSQWLAGLEPREVLSECARVWLPAGGRAITLDATAPGFRPRELDRSARRDLASSMRREEIALAGIDVFIPSEHFARPDTRDRAASAVLGAIEMGGQIGARHVAIRAGEGLPGDVEAELSSVAERHGVTLAGYGRVEKLKPAVVADASDPALLASRLSGAAVVRWPWPVPVSGAEASTAAPLLATLGVRSCDLDLSTAGDPSAQTNPALSAWKDAADPFAS